MGKGVAAAAVDRCCARVCGLLGVLNEGGADGRWRRQVDTTRAPFPTGSSGPYAERVVVIRPPR